MCSIINEFYSLHFFLIPIVFSLPLRDIQCPLYLSGWIAATSVRLFVNHPERYHYLAILGQEPPEQLSLATHNRKFDDKEMETEDPTGTAEGETLKGIELIYNINSLYVLLRGSN